MSNATMSTLTEGMEFFFPSSRKPNVYMGFDDGLHMYEAANGTIYDTANDCVISLKKAPKGSKVAKATKVKKTRKIVTAKQREKSIKATTSVKDSKVLEARMDAVEESLEILKAAMKTQSEALQAITKVLGS